MKTSFGTELPAPSAIVAATAASLPSEVHTLQRARAFAEPLIACEQLDTGAERVNAAVTEFRSVIDLVARLGTHVTNFAAVMEQVQQVSQSIEQIAKTTNMLALNAAIEAARAGESGRGFAVVADEVRALAHRTQQSTLEIDQMVSAMRAPCRASGRWLQYPINRKDDSEVSSQNTSKSRMLSDSTIPTIAP